MVVKFELKRKQKPRYMAWENCVTSYHLISKTLHSCNCDCESPTWTPFLQLWLRIPNLIAFITWNSNLEPLLEGLYSWLGNPCRFEFTVAWGFAGFACRHRVCGFPPQFGSYRWFERAFLLIVRVLDSFLKSCPHSNSLSLSFSLSRAHTHASACGAHTRMPVRVLAPIPLSERIVSQEIRKILTGRKTGLFVPVTRKKDMASGCKSWIVQPTPKKKSKKGTQPEENRVKS